LRSVSGGKTAAAASYFPTKDGILVSTGLLLPLLNKLLNRGVIGDGREHIKHVVEQAAARRGHVRSQWVHRD
jgi:hypothetical protein